MHDIENFYIDIMLTVVFFITTNIYYCNASMFSAPSSSFRLYHGVLHVDIDALFLLMSRLSSYTGLTLRQKRKSLHLV